MQRSFFLAAIILFGIGLFGAQETFLNISMLKTFVLLNIFVGTMIHVLFRIH